MGSKELRSKVLITFGTNLEHLLFNILSFMKQFIFKAQFPLRSDEAVNAQCFYKSNPSSTLIIRNTE